MTLAEFKRTIRPGDFVTMTENTRVPNLPFIGKRRRVARITSRYLVLIFEQPGDVFDFHTPLPKAQDFVCDGKSFTFTHRSVMSGRAYRITYSWQRKLVEMPRRARSRLDAALGGVEKDRGKVMDFAPVGRRSGRLRRRFNGEQMLANTNHIAVRCAPPGIERHVQPVK